MQNHLPPLIEELRRFSPRKLLLLLTVALLMNTMREAIRQFIYLYNSLAPGFRNANDICRNPGEFLAKTSLPSHFLWPKVATKTLVLASQIKMIPAKQSTKFGSA